MLFGRVSSPIHPMVNLARLGMAGKMLEALETQPPEPKCAKLDGPGVGLRENPRWWPWQGNLWWQGGSERNAVFDYMVGMGNLEEITQLFLELCFQNFPSTIPMNRTPWNLKKTWVGRSGKMMILFVAHSCTTFWIRILSIGTAGFSSYIGMPFPTRKTNQ